MIVGQIHWLSTEEENTCPVFEEKSHKNKVRDCLPKTGAICLSAVIKLCFMFSYWPTVATSITASLLKQMIKEIPLLGITFFLCLWNLRLIFFRNLQKKFQNLGVLHQYWPIQDNVSNMALSYNKLWFFFSSKPYLRAIFETRFVFPPKHSSSYIFKYSQQNFCQGDWSRQKEAYS